MSIRILTTWTICILLPLIIPFSLGAAVRNNDIPEPKTMFEAVARKCPNLESTELKDNEILTNRCQNWSEITSTTYFNNTSRANVECLVFYEALVSFCTKLGDTLGKVQGAIPLTADLPKLNLNVSSVCSSQVNLPLNGKEHNISILIRNTADCYLLCLDFSDSRVSDVCKFAYYFTTFNVTKFIQDVNQSIEARHHDHILNDHLENKLESVKQNITSPKVVANNNIVETPVKPDTIDQQKAQEAAAPMAATKPKQTEKGPSILQQNIEHQIKPGVEPLKQEPDLKPPVPQVQVVTKSNAAAVNEKIPDSIQQPIPKPQVNENHAAPDSPAEKLPEQERKPDIPEKAIQEGNNDYANEEKSQIDDQDADDPEMEQDEGDVKPEHGMPDEDNEPKVPSKKVKPSTVEDEAVNTFNAPGDDMDGDSYFFSYFTVIMCLLIVGYVGYHNRQKVLALILEGKKGRKPGRSRRPNSANYHKLDTNLEEAISSSCAKTTSNVIY